MDSANKILNVLSGDINILGEVISMYNQKRIDTREHVKMETKLRKYFNVLRDPDMNSQLFANLVLELQDYILELFNSNIFAARIGVNDGQYLDNLYTDLTNLHETINTLNLQRSPVVQRENNTNLNAVEQAVNNATENNTEATMEDFIQTDITIGQTLGALAGYATFGLLSKGSGDPNNNNDGFPPDRPYSGPPAISRGLPRYVRASQMVASLVVAGGKLFIGALGTYTAAVFINKLINYGYNDLPKYFGYNEPVVERQPDNSYTYTNLDLKQGAIVSDDGKVSYFNLENTGSNYEWVASSYDFMDSYVTPEMKQVIDDPIKAIDNISPINPKLLMGLGAAILFAFIIYNTK